MVNEDWSMKHSIKQYNALSIELFAKKPLTQAKTILKQFEVKLEGRYVKRIDVYALLHEYKVLIFKREARAELRLFKLVVARMETNRLLESIMKCL